MNRLDHKILGVFNGDFVMQYIGLASFPAFEIFIAFHTASDKNLGIGKAGNDASIGCA